jgi:hypothetical protein
LKNSPCRDEILVEEASLDEEDEDDKKNEIQCKEIKVFLEEMIV